MVKTYLELTQADGDAAHQGASSIETWRLGVRPIWTVSPRVFIESVTLAIHQRMSPVSPTDHARL